jgi:hypothetical protein
MMSAGSHRLAVSARIAACFLVVASVLLRPAIAAAQQAPAASQTANDGNDLFRPPPNLFQILSEYKTAPGSGGREVTTEMLNLRLDHTFDLVPSWLLVLRGDLPLQSKNPVTSDNPAGDYLQGIGDADLQTTLVHNLDSRWTVGAGLRLIMPTGGDTLGSGKWQLMPGAGFRVALPEINASSYLEPIVRYDVSFAGDPTKKNISNLQIAPTFNIGLPDKWFFTLFPSADIRINFGDPITGQTGRLFLPFDARIGRKLTDNTALSLEIGVPIIKDYPVYDFKSQVRLNVTF